MQNVMALWLSVVRHTRGSGFVLVQYSYAQWHSAIISQVYSESMCHANSRALSHAVLAVASVLNR